MFGYATDETPEMMPMPLILSRKILTKLARLRQSKKIKWLRPDSKAQITVEYDPKGTLLACWMGPSDIGCGRQN